jgi:prevent-host-death family protein
MWTVQEAKAKLSQVLQRARAGEAQVIGAREPCVVISLDEYKRLTARDAEPHPGKWLVDNLAGLGEIELPPRDDARPAPFADRSEADWAKLDSST